MQALVVLIVVLLAALLITKRRAATTAVPPPPQPSEDVLPLQEPSTRLRFGVRRRRGHHGHRHMKSYDQPLSALGHKESVLLRADTTPIYTKRAAQEEHKQLPHLKQPQRLQRQVDLRHSPVGMAALAVFITSMVHKPEINVTTMRACSVRAIATVAVATFHACGLQAVFGQQTSKSRSTG